MKFLGVSKCLLIAGTKAHHNLSDQDNMFKRLSKDNQLLLITTILVVLMGIPTFHSLVETEEVVGEQSLARLEPLERSPASVPIEPSAIKVRSAVSQFTEYDLNCFKKNHPKTETVMGNYIQFQGKNCLKNFKDGDVEIFNKSNGYTASTLSSGSNKYQTDMIQLQNGENEIVIRYREHSGKTVEEVIRIHSTQI